MRARWRTLLVCGLVGAVAGLVVTLLQIAGGESPWLGLFSNNRYHSSAMLQINPPAPAIMDAADNHPAGQAVPFDAYVESEIAKITGRRVLARVSKALDLTKRWGLDADSAVLVLKRSITASRVGSGNLLEIAVTFRDREMARDIAAETARAFRDECNQTDDDASRNMIEGLKRQIRMQEDQVEQARKLLAQIVRSMGIVHPAGRMEWTLLDSSAMDGRVRGLKARVELLEKAAANPSLALAVDTPDNPVKAIYPKFAEVERRLAAARVAGGASGQPAVEGAEKERELLREQLAAGVEMLHTEAVALLELAGIEREKLHAEAAGKHNSAVVASMSRTDYDEAHSTHRMESDLLMEMRIRLANIQLENGLRPCRVAVVEDPVIGKFKGFGEGGAAVTLAPRNVMRGAITGLLVGFVLAMLLEMRAAYAAGRRTAAGNAAPETTAEASW